MGTYARVKVVDTNISKDIEFDFLPRTCDSVEIEGMLCQVMQVHFKLITGRARVIIIVKRVESEVQE